MIYPAGPAEIYTVPCPGNHASPNADGAGRAAILAWLASSDERLAPLGVASN
jgi:hypothetical protein